VLQAGETVGLTAEAVEVLRRVDLAERVEAIGAAGQSPFSDAIAKVAP
jgi:hypothetical protein